MKVAIYTIALNEAAHAERWAASAADADYRIVADTGSTDDTVERLTRAGVTVHRIAVRPWRFDVARNTAMALIPDDVDVCCTMDMDMYLEPGWRPKLEAAWSDELTALYCRMVLRSSVDDPTPIGSYPAKNFHRRWGYRFKRPVHEALFFSGEEVTRACDEIVVSHLRKTATNHDQYLGLMELACKEDPRDAQICFWLGREHMWANQHQRAIELLQRYLSLPTSTWRDERSEAMRYLARLLPDKRMQWLNEARIEAPHRREIWLDLAEELHSLGDWPNLFWASSNGIERTHQTGSYLDDNQCWGFRLFDLAAIAAWHLDVMDRAVEWGQKALELDAGNQRLKNNLDFFIRRRDEIRAAAAPTLPKRESGSGGTVVRNIIDGQTISFLVTNPHDEIMKCHYAGAFYDADQLDLVKRHYTGGGVFVDIGANVGNHAIYISRFVKCARVIAFEPNQAAIPVLKENLHLNQCDNVDIRFLGTALAAKRGRLRQSTPDPDNFGHTRYVEDASGDVQAIDGDALLHDEAIEFIKIDVEGMAVEILSGLDQTIGRWQPTILIDVRSDRLGSIVDWCERASYQLVECFRGREVKYLIKPMSLVMAASDEAAEEKFRERLDDAMRASEDGGSWLGVAQWYRDAQRPFEAAVFFARCASKSDRPEETWFARWQYARCLLQIGSEEGFVEAAREAFRLRPHRAEPLHDLARYYLGKSRGDLAIAYAEAGLAVAMPEHDTLGVEQQVYATALKEAFTIAASYSKDAEEKERGRRICYWLSLSRDVPDHVRGLARYNSCWYVEPAQALMPSIHFYPLLVHAPGGYAPGNVSVARHGEGFVALIPCTNHDLREGNEFERHAEGAFRHRILLCDLDERFQVVSSTEVLTPADMLVARHVALEDVRLFKWRNELWCLSCARQLDAEGATETVLARIDCSSGTQCVLADRHALAPAVPELREKNWMPQLIGDELRFFCSMDPIRILGGSGTVLLNEPAAVAAENFRWGSQAIAFDDGWLMVIRESELIGERWNHFHRFVWLDLQNRLARLSRRFFFQRMADEFAAGLAWHVTGEDLVVSFGIDDREPMLAIVRADDVRAALLTVEDHKKQSDQACEAGRHMWQAMRENGKQPTTREASSIPATTGQAGK
ncbi:MAG: FkbM family methyltransferase [Alphaproteobacteria bacterium]|nr:FkbM family methyltransferase [Alphaproteobacteria bacterium]